MDTPEPVGNRGNRVAVIAGVVVMLAVAAVLTYIALQSVQGSGVKPIGEVLADLRTYDEQLVRVEGTVSQATNLMGFKFFTLTDETGTINVVTERGLPSDGATVEVEGYVKQLFEVAGMQKTVIYEPVAAEG